MHSPSSASRPLRHSCGTDVPCCEDGLAAVDISQLDIHAEESHAAQHHRHYLQPEELEKMTQEDLIAKHLLLQKHHRRLREECRHLKTELQARVNAYFSIDASAAKENRSFARANMPPEDHFHKSDGKQKRNPTFSDPPIFEQITETSEFYTISAQTAASDRVALSASPVLLQDFPGRVYDDRATSNSPLSATASSKDYIRRINQLNLKIFSMERDLEFERMQWHEEKTQLREEIYTLRQNAAFYQEKLLAMAQERESLTMAAEASSENSFNQSKKMLGIASPYSTRFFKKIDPETRQRSVSTSQSVASSDNPVHKFEQLKRSFTDSIRSSPPVVNASTDTPAIFLSSVQSHSPLSEIPEPKLEKQEHRQRFAQSLHVEKPAVQGDLEVAPWISLTSTRPDLKDLATLHSQILSKDKSTSAAIPVQMDPSIREVAKAQQSPSKPAEDLPAVPRAPRLTRSITSRKNRQSLCAPSSFLSNT